jgi:hypothetical protein
LSTSPENGGAVDCFPHRQVKDDDDHTRTIRKLPLLTVVVLVVGAKRV